MADRVDAAWAGLRDCLDARSHALQDEVRTYPTPIARCDEQLTHVIERRDTAFRQLRAAAELDGIRAAVASREWRSRLRDFAASLDPADDPILAAQRARLVAALAD
ncbi:MAG TPA: hypothetical protein VEN28_18090 [Burkholderiaceae bacterium]|nr:hypothetical protein [Burkholderiaceae bacterium]